MKFEIFGWKITIERIPKPVIKVIPQPPPSKRRKYRVQKCLTMDKVMMPEALAKLRAKQLAPKTLDGYLRAYKCEFCGMWHLTHKHRFW